MDGFTKSIHELNPILLAKIDTFNVSQGDRKAKKMTIDIIVTTKKGTLTSSLT